MYESPFRSAANQDWEILEPMVPTFRAIAAQEADGVVEQVPSSGIWSRLELLHEVRELRHLEEHAFVHLVDCAAFGVRRRVGPVGFPRLTGAGDCVGIERVRKTVL